MGCDNAIYRIIPLVSQCEEPRPPHWNPWGLSAFQRYVDSGLTVWCISRQTDNERIKHFLPGGYGAKLAGIRPVACCAQPGFEGMMSEHGWACLQVALVTARLAPYITIRWCSSARKQPWMWIVSIHFWVSKTCKEVMVVGVELAFQAAMDVYCVYSLLGLKYLQKGDGCGRGVEISYYPVNSLLLRIAAHVFYVIAASVDIELRLTRKSTIFSIQVHKCLLDSVSSRWLHSLVSHVIHHACGIVSLAFTFYVHTHTHMTHAAWWCTPTCLLPILFIGQPLDNTSQRYMHCPTALCGLSTAAREVNNIYSGKAM